MSIPTAIVAMVRYKSFWDWLFSLHTASGLLLVGGVAAWVIVIFRIAGWSPRGARYFSPMFCWCLLPFALCGAAGVADNWRLGPNWRDYYPSLWDSNSLHMTIFGVGLSGVAIVVYSLRRRSRA